MTTRAAAASKCNKMSIKNLASERGISTPKAMSKRDICDLLNTTPQQDGVKLKDFFVLERLLGKGNFGQVWLAVDKSTGQEYALKLLENMTEDSKREVAVLSILAKGCKHDNVLCYYDHFRALISLSRQKEKLYYVIQTEFIDGVEMHKWQNDWYTEHNNSPPKAVLHRMAKSLTQALVYVHKNRVYHLDVKPSNIIIRRSNGECVLIDFGLACSHKSKDPDATCEGTEGYGTPGYMSPDYALHCLFNPQLKLCDEKTQSGTDIWALGLTVLAMVQGINIGEEFQTFYEETVLENDFRKKDEDAFVDLISSPESLPAFKTDAKLTNLISAALQVDPKKRASANELSDIFS